MIDERFYVRSDIVNLADLLAISDIQNLVTTIDHIQKDVLTTPIASVATLKDAGQGQIAFFDNPKYKQDFFDTKAQFCITHERFLQDEKVPNNLTIMPSSDPYRLYALCAAYLYKDVSATQVVFASDYYEDAYGAKIHKNATLEPDVVTAMGVVIEDGVNIGSHTIIKPNVTIGAGSQIGRHCFIDSHVTISHALIGDHVSLFAGVKVGQDGFGFAMGKTHQPVPQLGRVIIQDYVTIGANSCIDRGAINDTIIGEGTCIDNLVQIAHNVVIGVHCVIAGNSSIAGSVTFGDYVMCGGHSCIAGHIYIHAQARISGGAAVMRDVPAGKTVAGAPAQDIKKFFKTIAAVNKLAE